MKIVFTGGGTGGHFYPLIAVAQEINEIVDRENLANVRLYYFSDAPYDETSLFEQHLEFVQIPAGKRRVGGGLQNTLNNLFDIPRMAMGIVRAVFKLYRVFPDVVFGKGGYASFPTLVAARILGIPVFIHESDSAPGRVSLKVSQWARRIALSYAEATDAFPKNVRDRIAHTGQPIRRELARPITEGAYEYLRLEPGVPLIAVLGGSQGAQMINEVVWEILPDLLRNYQVIHQVGPKNIDEYTKLAEAELYNHEHRSRYKPVGFLNALSMSMVGGVASVIVSRAGATTIANIAAWGVPSIIVPITNSNGDHQRKNAYNYARAGACVVMEEANLAPHVLAAEIDRVVHDVDVVNDLKQGAHSFHQADAAQVIAEEIIRMALSHEAS